MSPANLYRATATITALLWLAGCATNPVTGQRDFVMLSEQDEINLGREGDSDVRKQYRVYDDAKLQAYVQRIGEGLAKRSHRQGLIYRFTVLDSPEVNAFALPGGYIYITRGIMAYLNSEAELAAVLGHELGHVTARHGVRQYSAAMAAGIGYTLASILVPDIGGSGSQSLFESLAGSILSGYGREHELEADRLGAEYIARNGYDPDAMTGVIGVLKNQEQLETRIAKEEGREPKVYHGVFASHPSNDKRLQEVVAQARQFKSPTSVDVRRERYLGMIDGLVYGDSPRDGIIRGNSFYHRELDFSFSFPAGWKIKNLPRHINISSPAGDALLQFTVVDRNRQVPPDEFLRHELKVSELQSGQALNINGMNAFAAVGRSGSLFKGRPTRMVVIYHGKRAAVFIGSTRDGNLAPFDNAFLGTAHSFTRLGTGDVARARATRLRLVRARAGETFASLARQSQIPNYPEYRLRLLNDRFPSGEPRPGELIKVVE